MNKEISIEPVKTDESPLFNGRNPYKRVPAKIIKCHISPLFPAVYTVRGVKYTVESRFFVPGGNRPTAEKSFGNALLTEAVRLTKRAENGIMESENMCSASATKEVINADE